MRATGLTFAGTDEEIAVRSDSAEGQVNHGPGVTGAGERSLSHRHGPPAVRETVRTEGGDGATLGASSLASRLASWMG